MLAGRPACMETEMQNLTCLALFFLPSLPLPLRSGSFKPARGSWERCKLARVMFVRTQAENEFDAL